MAATLPAGGPNTRVSLSIAPSQTYDLAALREELGLSQADILRLALRAGLAELLALSPDCASRYPDLQEVIDAERLLVAATITAGTSPREMPDRPAGEVSE